ncbi:MAG: PGPGW domain-containing protein [Nitrospirota bacterium]|nr:PGPGW domain-containing protein [Nitrospirota bacterium]
MEPIFSKEVLLWISISSGIALLLTAIAIPIVIVKLPTDYLVNDQKKSWLDAQPAVVRVSLRMVKNLFGVALVVLGIIMLVLPGQGVLSIVLGLSLVDFPGRRALQCKLIRRPKVIDSINWIRKKFHRPPLKMPETC